MIHVYQANHVKALVLEFYEKAWKTLEESRRVFEKIGLELTKYALMRVPLMSSPRDRARVYAGPIARAGCGLFRPSIIGVLKDRFQGLGQSFETFGMGLSRSNAPIKNPATVYWNTLRSLKDSDLSSSLVLIYDMGEATGSTITGAIHELKSYGIPPDNTIFLLGAACVDQTRNRLESVAQKTSLVIGSKWKYDERPGPTQFYLTHIYDNGWIQQPPRDWGRCISGLKNQATVKSFIEWVGETIKLSQGDEEKLFKVWSRKINEKKISR